jgi:hypothetical protein
MKALATATITYVAIIITRLSIFLPPKTFIIDHPNFVPVGTAGQISLSASNDISYSVGSDTLISEG